MDTNIRFVPMSNEDIQQFTIPAYLIATHMYHIYDNDEYVGYLIANDTEHDDVWILDYIEIKEDKTEQGIGTRVIHSLHDAFGINTITGQVLTRDRGRAYYFWDALGADIDVDIEDFQNGEYEDIHFTLALTT